MRRLLNCFVKSVRHDLAPSGRFRNVNPHRRHRPDERSPTRRCAECAALPSAPSLVCVGRNRGNAGTAGQGSTPSCGRCRIPRNQNACTLAQAKEIVQAARAVVNERRWSTPESRASNCAAGFAGRPHCNRARQDQARRPSRPEFRSGRSAGINSPSRPLPCHRMALGRRQWRLQSQSASLHHPVHSSPQALPHVLQRPGSGRLARLRRVGVPYNAPRRKVSASPRPVPFHFAPIFRHCLVQGSHVSAIGSADQDRVGCGTHPAGVRRLLESASLSGGPHIDLLTAFMSEAAVPEPPVVRIAIREDMDSRSVQQTLGNFSLETITVWPLQGPAPVPLAIHEGAFIHTAVCPALQARAVVIGRWHR